MTTVNYIILYLFLLTTGVYSNVVAKKDDTLIILISKGGNTGDGDGHNLLNSLHSIFNNPDNLSRIRSNIIQRTGTNETTTTENDGNSSSTTTQATTTAPTTITTTQATTTEATMTTQATTQATTTAPTTITTTQATTTEATMTTQATTTTTTTAPTTTTTTQATTTEPTTTTTTATKTTECKPNKDTIRTILDLLLNGDIEKIRELYNENSDKLVCTTEYKPICAKNKDGKTKTFSNICSLNLYNSLNKNDTYSWVSSGECTKLCPECKSNKYSPVCGYNSKKGLQTFANICMLDRYNCLTEDETMHYHFVQNGSCRFDLSTEVSCRKSDSKSESDSKSKSDPKSESDSKSASGSKGKSGSKNKSGSKGKSGYKGKSDSKSKSDPTSESDSKGKSDSKNKSGTKGPSTINKKKCNFKCNKKAQPVCACCVTEDGIGCCRTFNNICELKKYNCQNPQKVYRCVAESRCKAVCEEA